MFERFTDGARQVVVLAQEEARRLRHAHIGTEHLLLALLRVPDSTAARALASLGPTPDDVRRQVAVLAEKGDRSPDSHIPFTPRGKRVLELAMREALELQREEIGPEHLLLGILREGDGAAVRVLVSLGVQIADALDRVKELLTGAQEEVAVGFEQRDSGAAPFTAQPWFMQMTPQSGDEPRCPRCGATAEGNIRSGTVPVTADPPADTPPTVTLLWCGTCGAVIGALPA